MGDAPAPGLPMFPRSNRRLTISLIAATPFFCWVRPMAHVTMTRSAFKYRAVSSSISSSVRPVESSTSPSSNRDRCALSSSNPSQCSAMNRLSSTVPGLASSACRTRLDTACSSAMSPPSRICMNWSAMSVPRPMMPFTFCGFLYRRRPASGKGLTATIEAPFFFATSRAVNIRGWLVPGF